MGLLDLIAQDDEWRRTTCGSCGVEFASPLLKVRRSNGESFYCPNGHSLHFTETEESRLRKEVQRLQESRDFFARTTDTERAAAKWARADAKRAKTKLRKVTARIEAGVCPHCNRTFQQLARHMACKHS